LNSKYFLSYLKSLNEFFNKLEELTKDELNEMLNEFGILDEEPEKLYEKECQYRQEQGNTFSPDDNLCRYCRNNNQKQKFCWDCDKGSLYIPLTRPLFNLVLMYLSLDAGMDNAGNKLQQTGLRDAMKILIQPFGINEAIDKYKDEILNDEKGYNSLDEIENANTKNSFKQCEKTEEEDKNRYDFGTFRCNENACKHCIYNDRFNTKFCWKCDRGSNFRNGIRSIDTIEKILMWINTAFGERKGNDWKLYVAEGLRWAITPYTTEEQLIEKNGFQYISEEDINYIMECEDNEYRILNEGKSLY